MLNWVYELVLAVGAHYVEHHRFELGLLVEIADVVEAVGLEGFLGVGGIVEVLRFCVGLLGTSEDLQQPFAHRLGLEAFQMVLRYEIVLIRCEEG